MKGKTVPAIPIITGILGFVSNCAMKQQTQRHRVPAPVSGTPVVRAKLPMTYRKAIRPRHGPELSRSGVLLPLSRAGEQLAGSK
jgi:hypothetical protein